MTREKLWKNTPENFWAYVDAPDANGCRVWIGKVEHTGYGRVSWLGSKRLSHRVAAYLSGKLDYLTSKSVVMHTCDYRRCCNPDHLRVATQKDNMRDAVQKRRMKQPDNRGEASGNAKLTNAEAAIIRERYAQEKLSQQALANEYGVTQMVISKIVRGVSYCG